MPRGMDGTGIAAIREGWEAGKKSTFISTYKRELHYLDFMGTKAAAKLFEKFSDYYYMIGHVRASTVGNDSSANAHPFHYGNIVLVHNGTVDKQGLTKADEIVDSAHIAATMAEKGEIETLEKLDGGYSLVWYNSKDDTLNFARNDRKPMAIAFVKKANTLYYASEYSTLWNVLIRNGVDLDGPIQIPRPGIHYKFHKEDLRKFDKEGFKIYSRRPSYPSHSNSKSYEDWEGTTPIIHRTGNENSTTHSAPATSASTDSNETSSTPATKGGAVTLHSNFLEPKPERISYINKLMEPYGFEFDQQVILRAEIWTPWLTDKSKGTIELAKVNNHDKNTAFRMVFANRSDFDKWLDSKNFVACRIANLMDVAKESRLVMVVKHDPEMQKLLDRDADMLLKLDNHGFLPDTKKEDSKSIIDAEIIEDKDLNYLIIGPNGGQITYKQFKELCKQGCCYCSDPLDPAQHGAMSYFNGEVMCPKCSLSPDVQKDLNLAGDVKPVTNDGTRH